MPETFGKGLEETKDPTTTAKSGLDLDGNNSSRLNDEDIGRCNTEKQKLLEKEIEIEMEAVNADPIHSMEKKLLSKTKKSRT